MSMEVESVAQIATVLLSLVGLIWHQQRGFNRLEDKLGGRIDRLDDKFEARFDKLDDKLGGRIDKLDDKFEARFDKLETQVVSNGERLARIEGRLEIMPEPRPTASVNE